MLNRSIIENRGAANFAVVSLVLMTVLAIAGCSQPRSTTEHPVVDAIIKNDVTITNQFLAEGGDPNMLTNRGDPLLFVATGARGGLDVATILLAAGANVNLPNSSGRTPLHNSAGWCNLDIVILLLENGGDTRAVDGQGVNVIDTVCTTPPDRRQLVLNAIFEQGQ